MTDFQRSIGDRYDDTDELYNITAQNIYDMPELYGEDNPHPIIKLATKAGQFKTPTYSYNPIEAAPIQASPGLLSNFTESTQQAKPGLLEQSFNSVNAGVLADGQLYDYARNQPSYEKTTDDYFEARTKAADTIMPKTGMSATQKSISSVAATNNNRGFEYLEPMQWGLKNSRADRALSFAANVLDAGGDFYADDVLKNGATSPWHSINKGFQVVGEMSERQEMLNSLADRFDPVSSVALKFLIAQFSENELQELITETRKRKEYREQRQVQQATDQK